MHFEASDRFDFEKKVTKDALSLAWLQDFAQATHHCILPNRARYTFRKQPNAGGWHQDPLGALPGKQHLSDSLIDSSGRTQVSPISGPPVPGETPALMVMSC